MVSESSATRMARSRHDKEQGEDWRSSVGERSDAPLAVDLARAHEPGRGREADRPGEIPPPGWNDIIWRVIWSISADRILSTSGGVAFFALLAVFSRDRNHRLTIWPVCRRRHDRKSPVR